MNSLFSPPQCQWVTPHLLHGTLTLPAKMNVPADKSITHRALILSALAEGVSEITGLSDRQILGVAGPSTADSEAADISSTARCLRALGVLIFKNSSGSLSVKGRGMKGLVAPTTTLDCGNSGTTLRLLMGVLAGQEFTAELTGDTSLRRRPMRRVALPLREMGALVSLTEDQFAPLKITGTAALRAIRYELPVASAQLKSAVLLAGLFARGTTSVCSPMGASASSDLNKGTVPWGINSLKASRDHTERLLPQWGVPVKRMSGVTAVSTNTLIESGFDNPKLPQEELKVTGPAHLQATQIFVPGDFSSAAFWIVARVSMPGNPIELASVSLNPTRTGLLSILLRMGAHIEVKIESSSEAAEPYGIIRVHYSPELRAVAIDPADLPTFIDEVPLLAILATQIPGRTVVRGAAELRVKESDRLAAIEANLAAMGVKTESFPDGFAIEGLQPLRGGKLDSRGDHRIAMAFSIAGWLASGETQILNSQCVAVSYPEFYDIFNSVL